MYFKAWFASDIHLISDKDPPAGVFIDFVNSLGRTRPATHLVLLGDIFDFWLGSYSYYAKFKYSRVIQSLLSLKERKIELIYFEGNHDIHIREFFRRRGVICYYEDQILLFGRRKFYLTHGDFINPEEVTYHKYIRWVRGPWAKWIIRILPPYIWWFIGRYLSQKSREKHKSNPYIGEKLKDLFLNYVQLKFKDNKFDFLVSGHIHQRIEWHESKDFRAKKAFNLGSWAEEPKVLFIDDQGYFWDFL